MAHKHTAMLAQFLLFCLLISEAFALQTCSSWNDTCLQDCIFKRADFSFSDMDHMFEECREENPQCLIDIPCGASAGAPNKQG
nr:hypothetical protein Itr_chr12CG20110 [Ipomoea trifida]